MLVTIFRTFDDKHELDSDENNDALIPNIRKDTDPLSDELSLGGIGEKTGLEMLELHIKKRRLLKDKQCRRILYQIVLNTLFVSLLFVFAYSDRNVMAFSYQKHVESVFTKSLSKVMHFFGFIYFLM